MRPLAELFPDGDYRFHLTLRRDDPREFFRTHDATGRMIAERARWLAAEPTRYAALRPEGAPLLAEFAELCAEWGAIAGGATPVTLGSALEPDFLLLSPDDAGAFRLRGGALCFPTGWALEEKLGHTLDAIHGVVPGLNAALAAPIRQFLAKLKPGVAFLRDNWGLAATDELNLHPARQIPPPSAPVALDRLWLRVEHQALVALPRTGGVLFGIRIALHRLDGVACDDKAAAGLRRALATMPAELAAYKRIDRIREAVMALL
jgi:dimethylamine monooxygenase subunit A